jgi:hypothetical protein
VRSARSRSRYAGEETKVRCFFAAVFPAAAVDNRRDLHYNGHVHIETRGEA